MEKSSEEKKDSVFILSLMRFIIFLIMVTAYFLTAAPFLVAYSVFPYRTRKIFNIILSTYSRSLLKILNFRVKIKGAPFVREMNGVLRVGNHLSYLDVLILAAFYPGCFVTSVEMKKTPFLGQICMLTGCLFVERRNKSNLRNEIKDITNGLKNKLNVFVFPEATSTDGSSVIRFRRALFQAAVDAETKVLPYTINYEKLNGHPVNVHNRDQLCWYGGMTFFDHFWNVLGLKSVEMSIEFHPLVSTHKETDITELANACHKQVEQAFHPYN
ncbi:MAG: lysophospholipid acyltransferase family protein [Bacteriovoracaceae bacterium]